MSSALGSSVLILCEMAQSTGNAQLKEHVALIDALRHKYADGEDAQSVAAIEALLSEASRTSESVDETAKDIIQSRCSAGETLLLFLLILLYSAQRVGSGVDRACEPECGDLEESRVP